ncbi:hypothetical protein EDB83DRAFT_2319538 [Lactarius deliciosus]|nr:hypothetical protein EDB83DRAFT_2319538 [Lactarius deliciosus]
MAKSATKSKVPTKKHNQKKKGYSTAILKAAIKLKNGRKHPASESESDESGDEESTDDKPKTRHKKKQAQATDTEYEELVDDSGPEVVEVEVVDDGEDGVSDNEPDEEHQRSTQQGNKRGDDLEDRHRVEIPPQLGVKKGLTKDLLTIFSDLIVVKFKKNEGYETVKGRWCLPCKADIVLVKKYGKRKAFHTGSNSSCRTHIRQHYELYKQRCKDKNIPENHYTVPRVIWKELQELRANLKAMRQGKLDGALGSMNSPSPHAQEYTQDGVLHVVARRSQLQIRLCFGTVLLQ